MTGNRIARVAVTQRLGHIVATEEHFAIFLDNPDLSKLLVLENLHLVHINLLIIKIPACASNLLIFERVEYGYFCPSWIAILYHIK